MSQVINIEFQVTSDLYFIRVTDISLWALIVDKPSIIEIVTPGSSKKIKKFFDKQKTNVFAANSLNTNCGPDKVSLEDGIYSFKVIGSPSTYSKKHYYLKTDAFDFEKDAIYIQAFDRGKERQLELQNAMTELEMLVKGAQAHLKQGIIDKAGMLFQKAIDGLERLKNCKNCG